MACSLGECSAECICAGVLGLLPFLSPGSSNCAMPADMATLVCRHRKNGDVWITTLCFFLFRLRPCVPFEPSALGVLCALLNSCSRAWSKLAILVPNARH